MSRSTELQRVVAETGSTHTILPTDLGTLFTNEGGGACTWYLPPIADVQAGWWVEIFVMVAGDQVITAPTDKMVLGNDATATSLTIGTNGEEIGNGVTIKFTGTFYVLFNHLALEAVTDTVA